MANVAEVSHSAVGMLKPGAAECAPPGGFRGGSTEPVVWQAPPRGWRRPGIPGILTGVAAGFLECARRL